MENTRNVNATQVSAYGIPTSTLEVCHAERVTKTSVTHVNLKGLIFDEA